MDSMLSELCKVAVIIVIAGFAGSQVADTWLNGSLFTGKIAWVTKRRKRFVLWELLSCGFCLRHWTTFAALIIMMRAGGVVWPFEGFLVGMPWFCVCWFAAVRVSVLFEREVVEEIDEQEAVGAIEIDWQKEQELLAREHELRQAEEELLQEELDEAECSISLNDQI